jgi:hypothetical protein
MGKLRVDAVSPPLRSGAAASRHYSAKRRIQILLVQTLQDAAYRRMRWRRKKEGGARQANLA